MSLLAGRATAVDMSIGNFDLSSEFTTRYRCRARSRRYADRIEGSSGTAKRSARKRQTVRDRSISRGGRGARQWLSGIAQSDYAGSTRPRRGHWLRFLHHWRRADRGPLAFEQRELFRIVRLDFHRERAHRTPHFLGTYF